MIRRSQATATLLLCARRRSVVSFEARSCLSSRLPEPSPTFAPIAERWQKTSSTLRTTLATCSVVLLAACASAPTVWVKPGASSFDAQRAEAQCDYEASAYTAGYGSGPNYARSSASAAGQGFGAGIGRSIEIRKLSTLCMNARGYYEHDGTVSSSQQAPAAQPSVPHAAPVVGRKFALERLGELEPSSSTTADARRILGATSSESTMSDGSKLLQWIYTQGSQGAHVSILFDRNDHMMRVTHQFSTGQ